MSNDDSVRTRPRHYLMCPPTYFDVVYEINPWMRTDVPVDRELAQRQWQTLADTYRRLGHTVDLIEPVPGQPDMVFTANAGVVLGQTAVIAHFRNAERRAEEEPYTRWLAAHRHRVFRSDLVQEGEGDLLWTGSILLAGSGFRTDPRAHADVAGRLGVDVLALELIDPTFYHLDTALAVLSPDRIAYLPAAFSEPSQRRLANAFPGAIIANDADAACLGLNAVSDGHTVVVAAQAEHLQRALAADGFTPIPLDLSEFAKSGGGIKCCTLELHAPPGGPQPLGRTDRREEQVR